MAYKKSASKSKAATQKAKTMNGYYFYGFAVVEFDDSLRRRGMQLVETYAEAAYLCSQQQALMFALKWPLSPHLYNKA